MVDAAVYPHIIPVLQISILKYYNMLYLSILAASQVLLGISPFCYTPTWPGTVLMPQLVQFSLQPTAVCFRNLQVPPCSAETPFIN